MKRPDPFFGLVRAIQPRGGRAVAWRMRGTPALRLVRRDPTSIVACLVWSEKPKRFTQGGDYGAYWRVFREAMRAWPEDRVAGVRESWAAFGAQALKRTSPQCATS